MPSTTSSTVSADFDSSTVMTPSLPTFSMASATRLPMVLSLLAAMEATCAISFLSFVDFDIFFSSATTTSTSLSMVGLPNFLSMTTLRPLGPIVAFTADAMMLTPRSRAARPSSLNRICFGIWCSSSIARWNDPAVGPGRVGAVRWARLLDNGQHVIFLHDQILLVVDLHLGPRVLAEENAIVGLHIQRDLLAVLVHLPVAYRDDLALLGLLLGGIRDDDAALLDFLLLLALDEDAVM